MHNVSQWPNLRHLGEPLGGAEGLPEAVSFKKAAESMSRAQRKSRECQMAGSEFPDCGACNTECAGSLHDALENIKLQCAKSQRNKNVLSSRLNSLRLRHVCFAVFVNGSRAQL